MHGQRLFVLPKRLGNARVCACVWVYVVSENHLFILNMAFSSLAYLLLHRETHLSMDGREGGRRMCEWGRHRGEKRR